MNFKNKSTTDLFQTQCRFRSAQNVKKYCTILQSSSTKVITFFICGINGWCTSITRVKIFQETSRYPKMREHIKDDWSLYSVGKYVSKIYHLNRLIEVADGDYTEERYIRLLQAWERCLKGRGIIEYSITPAMRTQYGRSRPTRIDHPREALIKPSKY